MKQKEYKNRGLSYYIKVWYNIVKFSFTKARIYKEEMVANIIRVFIIIFPQVIAIYSLYEGKEEYAGWKIEESFLILGIFNLINYLAWSFFSINLGRLDEKIENGEWDFLMLKPLSTIFSASFIDFFVYNIVLAMSGIVFIIYYLVKSSFIFSATMILKVLIVIISATVIWFAISLTSASFSFVKTHTGFLDLAKGIINIARFPVNTWPNIFQILFYTVIPIGFISTVPAKVIIGELSWNAVVASVLISFILLLFANKVWNVNVSKYSSTGS